jgi:glycosyltransferase involved in cell wall biosynthesis
MSRFVPIALAAAIWWETLLVSILIPTYNRAYCITAAIDSALAQTYRDVEVIVLDDGSRDDTAAVIAARYAGDPRVRYAHQANAGVAAARNHALRLARGELVALLDSDDTWVPWKLELQVDVLRYFPEAGMVWTDMDEILADGTPGRRNFLRVLFGAYRWYPTPESLFGRSAAVAEVSPRLAGELGGRYAYCGDVFSPMIMGNLVYTSSVVLRRDRVAAVGTFREDMTIAEDYDFHLRTCRVGPVAFVDVSSVRYRRGHADQLTRPEHRLYTAENFFKTVVPILATDRARITLTDAMIAEVMSESHAWLGVHLLDHGRQREAAVHLARSLLGNPRQPKMLGYLALSLVPVRASRVARTAYRTAKARVLARVRS